jgi:2-methylfumaryl-CoA isomerase
VTSAASPLHGLTILEISSFVAAPLGGLTLAQLGAEVIRVDPIGGGGDLGRWPLAPSGTSLYWTGLNKGKRSVTVNLRHAEGRRIVRELITASGPDGGIVLTNVALAVAGHLGFLAEAQLSETDRPRIGNHLYGGLARDFLTADGERVMIVVLTGRHFADLAAVTGLTGTFAELARLLDADFGAEGDRYRHRGVITALLEPWFADRPVADVERELASTSVLCTRYRSFRDLADDGTLAGNPLFSQISQPGVGLLLAPGSPLDMGGAGAARPAPVLGADTAEVLTGMLGRSDAEVRKLAEDGIAGNPP